MFRNRFTRAGILVCLPWTLAVAPLVSCATNRMGSIEHQVFVFKGVFKITVGSANVNWWLLSGSVSSVDVTPEPGIQLASATLRIYDDANGNGAYDSGENSKSFQSTTSGNGLSFSNAGVTAGEVANWNADRISCSVEVTQTNGKVSVWTAPI